MLQQSDSGKPNYTPARLQGNVLIALSCTCISKSSFKLLRMATSVSDLLQWNLK